MLKSLRLFNFRNFSEVEVEFADNLNIFIGNNAQGKTNLLESIYLLSNGSSFRSSSNEHLLQNNKEIGSVFGVFKKNIQLNKISIKLDRVKKFITVNEKRTNSNTTKDVFPTVLFSPESLELIKGSSENRRQLLDDLIFSIYPEKSKVVADYKKILKMRNAALKDLSNNFSETSYRVLQGINDLFLNHAFELSVLRVMAIEELKKDFLSVGKSLFADVSQDVSVDISVEYFVSNEAISKMQISKIPDILKKRLLELEKIEIIRGTSLVGPHKHDVVVYFNGQDSRYFCSQGQQRALILAIKMAQVNYHERKNGKPPVLLLDDVLSELDTQRQNSLINFLKSIKSQAFITTTDNSLSHQFEKSGYKLMKVSSGSVKTIDSTV
jgi:DNA replication and repair protein RecF